MEWVTGVLCKCYECKYDAEIAGGITAARGGIDFTKAEFRKHQDLRRNAYNAYIENKISNEELKSAHTKETEAERGHGRPLSVTTLFDLDTGNMVPDPSIDGSVRWETLWRASVREF
ncbi:MAG: hypothetical protein [Circular genetic element sp.]|nr:MAG: hypothetical protein [Circular genetic element sp.]